MPAQRTQKRNSSNSAGKKSSSERIFRLIELIEATGEDAVLPYDFYSKNFYACIVMDSGRCLVYVR